jgi:hypothetical protein
MKNIFNIILILLFLSVVNCHSNKETQNLTKENNYVFFLHNKFLEENPDGAFSTEYGVKAEYNKVLESFRKDAFIVFSEKRKTKTNWIEYAEKVTKQIDSLISKGVKPNHITVIGTSKGGYIAQYVSTIAKNKDLNFVFIGSYQDSDIEEPQRLNFAETF